MTRPRKGTEKELASKIEALNDPVKEPGKNMNTRELVIYYKKRCEKLEAYIKSGEFDCNEIETRLVILKLYKEMLSLTTRKKKLIYGAKNEC